MRTACDLWGLKRSLAVHIFVVRVHSSVSIGVGAACDLWGLKRFSEVHVFGRGVRFKMCGQLIKNRSCNLLKVIVARVGDGESEAAVLSEYSVEDNGGGGGDATEYPSSDWYAKANQQGFVGGQLCIRDGQVNNVSDDGAAMPTFESLAETSAFSRKWFPFRKKYGFLCP